MQRNAQREAIPKFLWLKHINVLFLWLYLKHNIIYIKIVIFFLKISPLKNTSLLSLRILIFRNSASSSGKYIFHLFSYFIFKAKVKTVFFT